MALTDGDKLFILETVSTVVSKAIEDNNAVIFEFMGKHFLTKEEGLTKEDAKNFATKDDLKNFATKDDLKNFATKDDLKNFATKDDLKNFATKDDLKNFATKHDLKGFATKDDFAELKSEINELKAMFIDLRHELDTEHAFRYQRLISLEARVQVLEAQKSGKS
ncbi:MAG: hypothetical protein TR69_WS6001000007 [candidate division WS6 bacterium OLB20]|uniref:Uncharacterized protein n=1 Tax=candidate division WS6 bacterium OLB20 TaxID=1617426 RepID=A0A136M0Z7_9BACT|nr:MAG: hypothetical protein TR69_WS6001000007 [candidate division WS6 bacterium OLB20]